MGEWHPISDWSRCADLARPGIVFELQNAREQSLFSPCGPLPERPFDWAEGPVRFRLVEEPPPRHSEPIPLPRDLKKPR
jgi:hypothetical protein